MKKQCAVRLSDKQITFVRQVNDNGNVSKNIRHIIKMQMNDKQMTNENKRKQTNDNLKTYENILKKMVPAMIAGGVDVNFTEEEFEVVQKYA